MKIGIVSDTHSLDIPSVLIEKLKKLDLIIHTGDFCSLKDLNFYKKLNNFKAVSGNMDEKEVCQQLKRKEIFKCEEVTIGLAHGHGPFKDALVNVQNDFKDDKVDIIMFGHSHQPFNKVINKILYFNAGSPNDTIRAPYCSYGLIEIIGKKINPKIVRMES